MTKLTPGAKINSGYGIHWLPLDKFKGLAPVLALGLIVKVAWCQSPNDDHSTVVCYINAERQRQCCTIVYHGATPPIPAPPPPPPDPPPPPPPPPPCGSGSGTCTGPKTSAGGLAIWEVSEPSVNLWLSDNPLYYIPSRGRTVRFVIRYKNRLGPQGTSENSEPRIFSVGSRWHTPWRSYLEAIPTESTNFWVYLGDGAAKKYTLDKPDYETLAKLTQISSTNVIQYADGSSDVFGLVTNLAGVTRHFLTRRVDLYGNAMTFQYLVNTNTIRLDKVIDVDNRSITFEYAAAGNYSNAITKVIGPHGLTNVLQYDSSGHLTNITDSIGLRSQMQYDATNLTTLINPYGTTTFSHFSITNLMDAVKVTELGVRNNLYLYYAQVDGGKVPANYTSYVPSTTNSSYFSIANTFDHLNSDRRNTLHWGPRQYENLSEIVRTNLNNGSFNVSNLTSTDYLRGRMNHWLKQAGNTNTGNTLSFRRDPSPDGSTQGQLKWYDYAGKVSGTPEEEGTMSAARVFAWKLPSGESRFSYSERNLLSHPTLRAETYTQTGGTCQLRTNKYEYAANNIDLTRHLQVLGATSRQVSSNVYNSAHHVLTNFNALGENLVYTYNANEQRLTKVTPAGLTTSLDFHGTLFA